MISSDVTARMWPGFVCMMLSSMLFGFVLFSGRDAPETGQ
jgi:hypothetical protein